MGNLLVLLMLALLVLLLIGFISPRTSLFWYKGARTRRRSMVFYGLLLITFIIIFGLAYS